MMITGSTTRRLSMIQHRLTPSAVALSASSSSSNSPVQQQARFLQQHSHQPSKSSTTSSTTTTSSSKVSYSNSSSKNNKENVRAASSSSNNNENTSSIVDFASDYLSTLRWHAAKALTASLSSQEQQDLLNRYSGGGAAAVSQQNDDEKNDAKKQEQQEQQHSIAEAVAAARAEEVRHQKEQWDREREQILQQAKVAAQERVENDLKIQQRRLAFQQWQLELEQQQQQQQQQQLDAQQDVAIPAQKEEEEEHPILGKCVYDFGYKRIHVISSKVLSSIPVWEKQRIYRHDRAKLMANDKLKTLHLGFPGIIAIHEDKNGNLSILDGQHRVGMMTLLAEKKVKQASSTTSTTKRKKNSKHLEQLEDLDLDHVLVEVYPEEVNKEEEEESNHAQELFCEVNKSEPIKFIDMPGVISTKQRKIIDTAAAGIQKLYPDMFKTNQNCRSPHLNIDNLRDALFSSDIFARDNVDTSSAKALQEWMLQQNELLKQEFNNRDDVTLGKGAKVTANALQKARKYDFYLGLGGMGWLLH